MDGLITNIQRFSVHDGLGIRTTVFFKRCPLSCIWCQNPETITNYPEILFSQNRCIKCKKCIEVCPNNCFSWDEGIIFGSDHCNQCGVCSDNCLTSALTWSSSYKSADDILEEVMKDKLYYDISGGGITFSGGEPLYQTDFLHDLVSKSKTLDLHVAVDTSGYVATEELTKVIPFVDLFLYDIKFIDNGLHRKYTGHPNELILRNFKKLFAARKEIVVRVPLITGITDTKKNLKEIIGFVKSCAEHIEINYIPFNSLIKQKYNMLGKKCLIKIR